MRKLVVGGLIAAGSVVCLQGVAAATELTGNSSQTPTVASGPESSSAPAPTATGTTASGQTPPESPKKPDEASTLGGSAPSQAGTAPQLNSGPPPSTQSNSRAPVPTAGASASLSDAPSKQPEDAHSPNSADRTSDHDESAGTDANTAAKQGNAARAAPEARDPLLIGARGSGEEPIERAIRDERLMGRMALPILDDLKARATGTPIPIRGYGLEYEAFDVLGRNLLTDALTLASPGGEGVRRFLGYRRSVAEGTRLAVSYIEGQAAADPLLKIALIGYSQGAHVLGDALGLLSDRGAASIAFAAFFGDPRFNPRSFAARGTFDSSRNGILGARDEFDSRYRGRIHSYCRSRDPICQGVIKFERIEIPFLPDPVVPRPVSFDPAEHAKYNERETTQAATAMGVLFGLPKPAPRVGGALDIVFTIDTTGSMFDDIAAVQGSARRIVGQVASSGADYRIGLVDYKDLGDAYQARVDLPFSTDTGAINAAIDALSASGGGDFPESVYSGIVTALSLPWRDGAKKVVILAGDAPPKDPEPGTGYTLRSVLDAAFRVDPASIYPILIGGDPSAAASFRSLAEGSGGQVFAAGSSSEVVDAILEALTEIARRPVADAGGPYSGGIGQPVIFMAPASADPDGLLRLYEWDFDNNGTVDASSPDPVIEHTYSSEYNGLVVLRVTDDDLRGAAATASVQITATALERPGPPTAARAALDGNSALVSWSAPASGGPADYYLIRLTDGLLVGAAGADVSSARITDLVDGSYAFTVTAVNAAGSSDESLTSNEVAIVLTQPPTPPATPPLSQGRSVVGGLAQRALLASASGPAALTTGRSLQELPRTGSDMLHSLLPLALLLLMVGACCLAFELSGSEQSPS